jgi:hypothetical protein
MTLLETAVSAAIAAIAIGGAIFAMGSFGRFATYQSGPNRAAASQLAQQTLRVAQDAWKYGPPGASPAGTWRMASATVTTSAVPTSAVSAHIVVTVQYTPDPGRNDSGTIAVSGDVDVKAPVPGSQIAQPALVPQPSGAP